MSNPTFKMTLTDDCDHAPIYEIATKADGEHVADLTATYLYSDDKPTVWELKMLNSEAPEAPEIPDGASLGRARRIVFEFLEANRQPTVADLEAAITRLREGAPAAIRALLGVLRGGVEAYEMVAFLGHEFICESYEGQRDDALLFLKAAASKGGTPDSWRVGGRGARKDDFRFSLTMRLRCIGSMKLGMWPNDRDATDALHATFRDADEVQSLIDALGVTVDPRMGTVETKA